MTVNDVFKKAVQRESTSQNTLGIDGIWFVGSGQDCFECWTDGEFIGWKVYNCCGEFIIAMKNYYKTVGKLIDALIK